MPGLPAIGEPRSLTDASGSASRDSPVAKEPSGNNGALTALFARIARSSERVIIAINDSALEEDSPNPAFYCVHSLSGAGGTDFCHLAKLMPEVRFYGIQAPPAKIRDSDFGSSVESIADYYANALVKFQPKGPFLLGGWSAGAIIGLEIAQRLRARGRLVRLFAAIDAAPENTEANLPYWHPLYVLEFARNLIGWIVTDVVMTKGSLRALIRRGLNKAIAHRHAKFDRAGDEKEAGVDPVEGFMDISRYPPDEQSFMKRLYAALLAYKPKKYAGTVVAYEATKKPLLHLPQVGRVWAMLAARSTIVRVTGTHLSILQPGDVESVASDLADRIAESAGPTDTRRPAAPLSVEAPPLKQKSA
jgi:thioesterase domain-containing protein